MEYRRDVLDVLLARLDNADRTRALAQIKAHDAAQRSKMTRGRAAPSAAGVQIFTSHRDRVTIIYIHSTADLAAAAFHTALDYGMHAGEPRLVVDLGEVSSLDAASLDVLVGAAFQAARRGKRIAVRRAQPAVFEEFVTAGLVARLDVHPARRTPRKGNLMSTTDIDGHEAREGDLDKIKGIGMKYRAILEEVGVTSIKELRRRNATNLKAMIEERHGAVIGLTELQVQTWIDRARAAGESRPV
ncbi:DUF4332 domain-containing protein [Frankia sp. CNm7]|uniref:DUF4332 domain-containing protein n=1 Tax=Frankia nepalensis TaxID=1836974 RepID=A0A937UQH3_9ACTN|nr:DUF4332 domain-containing protein [Frankia nepalensis]MBL7495619.1 DUF4332 domain-containing protein [Frankia nepalensis]MBL7508865.1 DUF4332 domain-containing protein [Frankia nepalensis]MBL7520313.1 DUF4332 domain-containing protein [Frankia nepalensis]MBL7630088.1 DUF4332 domain-containing protein [Frankia nepalensis]